MVRGMARANRLRVEMLKPLILSWRETEVVPTADKVWVLQEARIAYGRETYQKNSSKAIKCDGFPRIHLRWSELFGRQSVRRVLEARRRRLGRTKHFSHLDDQCRVRQPKLRWERSECFDA